MTNANTPVSAPSQPAPAQPTLSTDQQQAAVRRMETKARYLVFQKYAYDDQFAYYKKTITRNKQAAAQVNRIRALFALLTGLASALAGLLVQLSFNNQGQCLLGKPNATFTPINQVIGFLNTLNGAQSYCSAIQTVVNILLVLAVVAPAVGGAFNILASLYQWDRLTSIYNAAHDNLEFAFTRVPDETMDDTLYTAAAQLFAQDTLGVMEDESAQWGQSVRQTPTRLLEFLQQEKQKVDSLQATLPQIPKAQSPSSAPSSNTTSPSMNEPSVG